MTIKTGRYDEFAAYIKGRAHENDESSMRSFLELAERRPAMYFATNSLRQVLSFIDGWMFSLAVSKIEDHWLRTVFGRLIHFARTKYGITNELPLPDLIEHLEPDVNKQISFFFKLLWECESELLMSGEL